MAYTFGIIGNGSWATALAKMLTSNGNIINWWMRNEEAKNHLMKHHHNLHYLSSVDFNADTIIPSTNIQEVIEHSDCLVICVPSAYVVRIMEHLPKRIFENKIIISAIKGILPDEHVLLNDYMGENFNVILENYFSITGPCHAEEVALERLSYLTFSGLDQDKTKEIAQSFRTEFIQTNVNHDLYGSQYAAVLKNIYAIGAGMAHGLGYGDNFLSVYITNCYREMYYFLQQQFELANTGMDNPDFHTSAYLGDLLVTCYSPHSRNRTFGTLLGKGYSISAATAEMNMVAEGYFASKGMQNIISQLDLKLPMAQIIHEILWENKNKSLKFKEMECLLS